MYNKLFTKILDSSIWLTSDATRLVWITFLAAMDEDGFVQYATPGNVAVRARVSEELVVQALKELESPEPSTAYDGDDGRRIERVPGGWMVLNAPKYRDIVKREQIKEQTRRRVAKHRSIKCNADVTDGNENVTSSDTNTDTEKKSSTEINFERFWKAFPRRVGKIKAFEAFKKHQCDSKMDQIMATISAFKTSGDWNDAKFIPHPATWLNRGGWEDEPRKKKIL